MYNPTINREDSYCNMTIFFTQSQLIVLLFSFVFYRAAERCIKGTSEGGTQKNGRQQCLCSCEGDIRGLLTLLTSWTLDSQNVESIEPIALHDSKF